MTPPCETLACAAAPTVFVVDDNAALLRSLRWLFESLQLPVETYACAQAFVQHFDAARAGCLLLDVRMPGMSGLELQQHLAAQGALLPIVFMSAHGDIRMATRALKAGALDFIEKPFAEQDLLDCVHRALRTDAARRTRACRQQELQSRFDALSLREREVLDGVVQGHSNKAMAKDLGLSAKTVEVHRASLMAKVGAHSVADVVRLALHKQLLASPDAQGGSPV